MKFRILALVTVIGAGALCVPGHGGEDEQGAPKAGKKPSKLVQIDTNDPPPGKPWTQSVEVGDLVQVSVFCRANFDEENLRTLRITLTGGSAIQVGNVVEVPVWRDPAPGRKGKAGLSAESNKSIDSGKKHLCVFLIAAKPGESIVKVTPVGMDGKDRPAREVTIRVWVPPGDGEKSRRPSDGGR